MIINRHQIILVSLSVAMMILLPAQAAYRHRALISANLGGIAAGSSYQTHACLGQSVVSDWNGADSARHLVGIMHFAGLYDWLLPVDGNGQIVQLPWEFMLYQNFPNPFNPMTTIRYDVPTMATVNITVYNTRGQRVAVLVDGTRQPGYHEVVWDAAGLSSGVYFYRIHAGDYVALKKLMLLK
jgi:hypothetical protein